MASELPGEVKLNFQLAGRSFSVAGRLFFARKLVVPCVVAQAQLAGQGLGLSNTDFPAFVQKFLNKRIIGGLFGNMLHEATLATAQAACHAQFIGKAVQQLIQWPVPVRTSPNHPPLSSASKMV